MFEKIPRPMHYLQTTIKSKSIQSSVNTFKDSVLCALFHIYPAQHFLTLIYTDLWGILPFRHIATANIDVIHLVIGQRLTLL